MESGREVYDKALLDSLEKRYQLFLDSPNGDINVYLVLSKNDDESAKTENSHKQNNSNVLKQNKSFNSVYTDQNEAINNFS